MSKIYYWLILVFLGSCTKEYDKTEVIQSVTPKENTVPKIEDPYKDLSTTVIFEEQFDNFTGWIVDTSIIDTSGPMGVNGSGKRFQIQDGVMQLASYHLPAFYDSVKSGYVNPWATCSVMKDLGTIELSKRYLLELDIETFESSYNYVSKSGSHDGSSKYGGAQLFIALNGTEYDVFGTKLTKNYQYTPTPNNSSFSNCRNQFNQTHVRVILDSDNSNFVIKVDDQLDTICSMQKTGSIANNFIRFVVHPTVSISYGIGQPGYTNSNLSFVRISNVRLSVIHE